MTYNYIYVNSIGYLIDMDSYYPICINDLENNKNIHVIYSVPDERSKIIRFLYSLHTSKRINNIINLPFKKKWYPFYFKNSFKDDKPLCLVFQYLDFPSDFFYYIRDKFPDAKIVKVHRDLVEKTMQRCPGLTKDVVDKVFDLSLTFDEEESNKYNYPWFCEFESKLNYLKPSKNFGKYDVFFSGVVKDRLPILMETYKKLTSAGLKVNYYLVGVPKNARIPYEGIEYADKFISYKEMLQRSIDAKCLLEVNQSNCAGYTSRFLEAVMYNRLLITNNFYVKKHGCYNPEYIKCFSNVEDINPEFIKCDIKSINYHYNGEFSPIHMIETIDRVLNERYGSGKIINS